MPDSKWEWKKAILIDRFTVELISVLCSVCLCAFLFISYTDFSPIYESIHFDAAAAAAFTKTIAAINSNKTATTNAKNTDPTEPTAHPLQRQNAFDGIEGGVDRVVKRKQSSERDVRDFLERCIPPPPVTSPPPAPLTQDSDSDNTVQDLDEYPVQISRPTLMKLNSLYSVYKMRRSDCSETDEADGTDETNETTDDVVLRLHNKVDKCKSRLFRGSSKAMCSFVSVSVLFTWQCDSFSHSPAIQFSIVFFSECRRWLFTTVEWIEKWWRTRWSRWQWMCQFNGGKRNQWEPFEWRTLPKAAATTAEKTNLYAKRWSLHLIESRNSN